MIHTKYYQKTFEKKEKYYNYIEANYVGKPTRCCEIGCRSPFLTTMGSAVTSHKVYYCLNSFPTIMKVTRGRYKCKECPATFAADYQETEEWGSCFSHKFRNKVINHWLSDGGRSVYETSKDYGIDESDLSEWEDVLEKAFHKVHKIEGYTELVFGSFTCVKDEQLHAFSAGFGDEYNGLVDFIRDYSPEGMLLERERYHDRDKVVLVRYDFVPNMHFSLRQMFPNATLAINRTKLRSLFNSLLSNNETGELTSLLSPVKNCNKDDFYGSLSTWAEKISINEPNRDKVIKIVEEITENDDLFTALRIPHITNFINSVRTLVDVKTGRKASYNTVVLQIMYNNEHWKETVKKAGNEANCIIEFVSGNNWNNSLLSNKQHRFDGKEEITWFEISPTEIEEQLKK